MLKKFFVIAAFAVMLLGNATVGLCYDNDYRYVLNRILLTGEYIGNVDRIPDFWEYHGTIGGNLTFSGKYNNLSMDGYSEGGMIKYLFIQPIGAANNEEYMQPMVSILKKKFGAPVVENYDMGYFEWGYLVNNNRYKVVYLASAGTVELKK